MTSSVCRCSSMTSAGRRRSARCCTLDDLYDARRVAEAIGIPHYILNFERQFQETVISNFVREYAAGRTPLPCAHCNSDLKFATLLDRARGLGAEQVATGHYARVEQAADGRWLLRRSADPDKDQSYFLFSLTQEQLARASFPVGSLTKTEVRAQARRLGLKVAEKPDSQEICFVPDGDYAVVRRPEGAGCRARRRHRRHARRGARRPTRACIDSPSASARDSASPAHAPLYVLKIEAESGQVTVGPRAALDQTTLTASGVNWVVDGRAVRMAAGLGADPPSPSRRPRPRARARRRPRRVRLRRAAARHHARPGRRLLRRRSGRRRRLDRLDQGHKAQVTRPSHKA